MGRLKVPRALQEKWEKTLAAEGLAPLNTFSADAVKQRRLIRRLNSGTQAQTERYYQRASKFLRRIEMAHAVWSLHCEGLGGRAIATKLGIPYRVARLVLERCVEIAGL